MACAKVALTVVILCIASVGYKVKKVLFDVPSLPEVEETWWGPGDPGKEDTSVRSFKIDVPEEVAVFA